jgi:hypothetical protein
VTHAEASRYFLMLSETVELIMAAAALDDSGSIFIPKMCEPVKILDFATHDSQRRYADEALQPSSDERLYRAIGPKCNAQVLDASLQNSSESVRERNLAALIGVLSKLVPEYKPSETLLGLTSGFS